MPRMSRPPESWSSVAACLATVKGSRIGRTMTDVPRRMRWGMDATAARVTRGRNPQRRDYLSGASLSMGGDSIEHVISYWVLFQQFHSPALAGFAVISHWVPSLFSVYFGAWADRSDCRRIIQLAQLLFMSVSAAWGVLFLT